MVPKQRKQFYGIEKVVWFMATLSRHQSTEIIISKFDINEKSELGAEDISYGCTLSRHQSAEIVIS